jgi:GR25 family glycosyltransferase involved in LPS biosynthesis
MQKPEIYILFLFILIIFFWILYECTSKQMIRSIETFALNKWMNEDYEEGELQFKVFVINLKKDKDRYNKFMKIYNQSDMKSFPITRYDAVEGDKMRTPEHYLTDKALREMKMISTFGFRIAHYQLSKGGLGCFMSHLNLAKQLISDPTSEEYLIFEDDTNIFKTPFKKIRFFMKHVPGDWDYVLFYVVRMEGNKINSYFAKPNAFWGLNCYFVNKRGAEKLVNEVKQTKIDGQIDSYMARMCQQNKLNIYVCTHQFIESNSNTSNIQYNLITIPHIDPFMFNGYKV